MTIDAYRTITADRVVDILAAADEPLGSRAVMHSLGTQNRGKVVSVLTDLVRQETLEQVKGKYRLRDAGQYHNPGRSLETRREPLETDTEAKKAKERRADTAKAAARAKDSAAEAANIPPWLPSPPMEKITPDSESGEVSTLPNRTIPVDKSAEHTGQSVDKPVTKLEEIEQMVDENKARDQRIRDAIERLKCKASQQVEPVADMNFKIEILDGLGGTDADLVEIMRLIVADLRRLDALAV